MTSVNITSSSEVIKMMIIITVTPIAKGIGLTDVISKRILDMDLQIIITKMMKKY